MMTCKEVLESLSSLIDEDLKQDIRAEMHRHIGMCSDCRAEFDSIAMTIKLYRHVERPQLPDGCHDRLVKILEIEKLRRREGQESSEP